MKKNNKHRKSWKNSFTQRTRIDNKALIFFWITICHFYCCIWIKEKMKYRLIHLFFCYLITQPFPKLQQFPSYRYDYNIRLILKCCLILLSFLFILLTPKSDKHFICSYSIIPKLHFKVTRIKEMISNFRRSWFLKKLSLSAPYEMHRERYKDWAHQY